MKGFKLSEVTSFTKWVVFATSMKIGRWCMRALLFLLLVMLKSLHWLPLRVYVLDVQVVVPLEKGSAFVTNTTATGLKWDAKRDTRG